METINLEVSGMTCGTCVKHVEQSINAVVGVKKVEVDLPAGKVSIQGDIAKNVQAILDALATAGYPANISSVLPTGSTAKSGTCKSGSTCCCR